MNKAKELYYSVTMRRILVAQILKELEIIIEKKTVKIKTEQIMSKERLAKNMRKKLQTVL